MRPPVKGPRYRRVDFATDRLVFDVGHQVYPHKLLTGRFHQFHTLRQTQGIAGYPPGVPALLPGERITAEVIAYLRELTTAGARLHGAADPSFQTVRVLAERNNG